MDTIIIVDLEATCQENNPDYNKEIIEIGAIKIVDGKIVDEFDVFVHPRRNAKLSDYCKNLTHITQEDVDMGLLPKEAITKFYNWATSNFTENIIFLSWGGFDKRELLKESRQNRLSWQIEDILLHKHFNLKTIYAKVLKLPRQVGTLKALEREDLLFDGTNHRAIDDVKNIYRIYIKRKNKIDKYLEGKLNENY